MGNPCALRTSESRISNVINQPEVKIRLRRIFGEVRFLVEGPDRAVLVWDRG